MVDSAVDNISPAVRSMRQKWVLTDAILEGAERLRRDGQRWVPMAMFEKDADYLRRLRLAELFPGLSHTIDTFSGSPFSSPLVLSSDMPEKIKQWCDNIDCCGTKVDDFAQNVLRDALAHGISYILVDHSKADNIQNHADELNGKVRPYLVHVKSSQILGWRFENIDNIERLTRVRISEYVDSAGSDWNDGEPIEQVRVLSPGRYEVYQKQKRTWPLAAKWKQVEQGETTLQEIPLIPIYAKKTGFMQGEPPFQALAQLNISHWALSSGHKNILNLVQVPFLHGAGFDANDMKLLTSKDPDGNPYFAMDSPSVMFSSKSDAVIRWVEHSGKAIESGRQALRDLEELMSLMGAQKLVGTPGEVTATAEVLKSAQGSDILLPKIASLQYGLGVALNIMGVLAGLDNVGRIDFNLECKAFKVNDQTFSHIVKLMELGILSHESGLEFLKRGKFIDEDVSIEDNVKHLLSEREALEKLTNQPFRNENSENSENTKIIITE